VRHQQPRDGERGFLELLELSPQPLAVLVQLLQGFVAVDEVTIGCNTELHVLVALVSKLLIIVLQYLAGLLFSVEEVLQIGL
jgi:hypothetical protein